MKKAFDLLFPFDSPAYNSSEWGGKCGWLERRSC